MKDIAFVVAMLGLLACNVAADIGMKNATNAADRRLGWDLVGTLALLGLLGWTAHSGVLG